MTINLCRILNDVFRNTFAIVIAQISSTTCSLKKKTFILNHNSVMKKCCLGVDICSYVISSGSSFSVFLFTNKKLTLQLDSSPFILCALQISLQVLLTCWHAMVIWRVVAVNNFVSDTTNVHISPTSHVVALFVIGMFKKSGCIVSPR